MDYTSINEKSTPISADQLSYVKNAIYDYFGVNENIVQNKFDENQWNAFYEGAIEPIAIQMSQCFTNLLFTENERNFGNKITFEANRLQYASNTTKISIVEKLAPLGVLRKNAILEIFNMAPLPDEEGNKVIQSLNWINAEKADEYQTNKTTSNDTTPTEPPKEDEDTGTDPVNEDEGGVENGDE